MTNLYRLQDIGIRNSSATKTSTKKENKKTLALPTKQHLDHKLAAGLVINWKDHLYEKSKKPEAGSEKNLKKAETIFTTGGGLDQKAFD